MDTDKLDPAKRLPVVQGSPCESVRTFEDLVEAELVIQYVLMKRAFPGSKITHNRTGTVFVLTELPHPGDMVITRVPNRAPVVLMTRHELGRLSFWDAQATEGKYYFQRDPDKPYCDIEFFLVTYRPFDGTPRHRVCSNTDDALITLAGASSEVTLTRIDIERYSEVLTAHLQHGNAPNTHTKLMLQDFSETNLRVVHDYIVRSDLEAFDRAFDSAMDVVQLIDFFGSLMDYSAVQYLDFALSLSIYMDADDEEKFSPDTLASILQFATIHRLRHTFDALVVEKPDDLLEELKDIDADMRVLVIRSIFDAKRGYVKKLQKIRFINPSA